MIEEKWAAFECEADSQIHVCPEHPQPYALDDVLAAARELALAVHLADCWACRRGLKECPRRARIEALK